IEVSLSPIHLRGDLFVLSMIVELTEYQRVERLKGEFVATVSHELRTPLTSIAGSLGLLVCDAAGKLPDSMARMLTIAHKNTQRLVRLVNDILDIERIASGKVVFALKCVEVRPLVEQAIEAVSWLADQGTVRLRLEPTATTGRVHADPDRLVQVIT